jgi:hypothetical protein
MYANIWLLFMTEVLLLAQLLDGSHHFVGTLHGQSEVEHQKRIPQMLYTRQQ